MRGVYDKLGKCRDLFRGFLIGQISEFNDRIISNMNEAKPSQVAYVAPYSEGGAGIKMMEVSDQISKLNPARAAKLCTYNIGVSQAGTVFSDLVVCSQPARVWNGGSGNRFSSSCTYYDPNISELCDVDKVTKLTRSTGKTLQKLGYRGAFGCDYLYDEFSSKFFFGEANLRYTGDIAIFCDSDDESATCANLLHPHSLHILAFMSSAKDCGLTNNKSYIKYEAQGGGEKRAFFDPGAPTRKPRGQLSFISRPGLSAKPPSYYFSHPVNFYF